MIASEEIIRWQTACVALWHQHPVQPASLALLGWGPPGPLIGRVLRNHELNFLLWHEEDLARDPEASDATIAAVKRRIDVLNQQRNDAIEQIDQGIAEELAACAVEPRAGAMFNTETPGSAVDRLSVLALRLYHYAEQNQRGDIDAATAEKASAAHRRCQLQCDRLSAALDQLLADLVAGRKRHDVFHQLKMYNDPSLNPVFYTRRSDN